LSVWTPLLSVVCWLLLELELPYTGATTGAVVWVDVVVEDDVCAAATPVIIARAMVAASQVLIMSCSPGNCAQAEIARCPAA
jgi:hypothetical protein